MFNEDTQTLDCVKPQDMADLDPGQPCISVLICRPWNEDVQIGVVTHLGAKHCAKWKDCDCDTELRLGANPGTLPSTPPPPPVHTPTRSIQRP